LQKHLKKNSLLVLNKGVDKAPFEWYNKEKQRRNTNGKEKEKRN
jgi:hypothetical protein